MLPGQRSGGRSSCGCPRRRDGDHVPSESQLPPNNPACPHLGSSCPVGFLPWATPPGYTACSQRAHTPPHTPCTASRARTSTSLGCISLIRALSCGNGASAASAPDGRPAAAAVAASSFWCRTRFNGTRPVIYPEFPLDLTGFFPGRHLIQFLPDKMQDFRNFVLHTCILIFDAEQVY